MASNASFRQNADHRRILREMLSIPTAPFAEHLLIDYIQTFCEGRGGLTWSRDAADNVLLHLRRGGLRLARPVCITAHLDHPGFVAEQMVGHKRLRAFWRGGVPQEYFVGSRVRFFADGQWIHGRVRSVTMGVCGGRRRVRTVVIDISREVPPGAIGMWDLPDPIIRGSRIHARDCDDVAGAAAILCCIEVLTRTRHPCDAYFLFTRAEEVGFVGAIAAARLGTVPKRCLVVSMENSSQRPNAKLGDGPILRVGDKTTTFTHAATAHCHRVAQRLAARDKSFRFQRRLMDGGTCESSAFCALGYEATGLCVALGNYHNIDSERRKLAPEYIDLNDFDNVVKWFVELARGRIPYTGRDEDFSKRLADLERAYKPLLRSTRRRPH